MISFLAEKDVTKLSMLHLEFDMLLKSTSPSPLTVFNDNILGESLKNYRLAM